MLLYLQKKVSWLATVFPGIWTSLRHPSPQVPSTLPLQPLYLCSKVLRSNVE